MENRETVVKKSTSVHHTHPPVDESPAVAYKKKKVIFRYYQAVWYLLGVIEALLLFRFFFRLIGADPNSPVVALIYGLSGPLAIPFIGATPTFGVNNNVFEWSTLIACVFYLIVAWGIIKLAQFIKPTSPEEVEVNVDETV